jgi:hypothetical protein
MSKTNWLGSASVALMLGITAAVAQNAPGASERRGESPSAQAPAKSDRAEDRQKERTAQDTDSKAAPKEVREPGRLDDKAARQQAQDPSPRDEGKQPARQSQDQDRNQRSPANAQRQGQEQDQKDARQPSDQRDAKQPSAQKDAKQPAEQRQQQTRDQQKQDSNRAADSKDGTQAPRQQSQQPAPTNQASQPDPAVKSDTAQDRQSQPGTGQAANHQGVTTSTQISEQQRTQVRETLSRDRAAISRENQKLNIQVTIGAELPNRVRLRSLPPDIVRIAPQYRGYDYTIIEDEIVILEPRTRRVVEVIEEPGRARQTTSRMSTVQQVLTDDQRQTLRQSVQRSATTGSTSSIGGLDAGCMTLQNLPDEMARANPDLRNYKMLTIGQQLVLIDPQQQKVVEVIE